MTVSALSGSDQTSLIKQLLASLQTSTTSATDATDPADSTGSAKPAGPPPGAPPGPPPPKPDSSSADRFSSDTLSSLLKAQEQPSASDVASKLIGDSDTDGSGTLSLDEVTKALSDSASTTGASASTLKDAFAKLDGNGDGQLSQDELTTGLQKTAHAHHGHHHHAAYAQAAAASPTPTSTTASAANDGTTASATDLAA